MAALGTGESAVDSGAPSRGDALDTGGLLPAALAFVPVTLGTGASLFGFFLQGEVFRHGHFFILALLAGTQMLCYIAGVIGLGVFSCGDARMRPARRTGIVLCVLCSIVLAVRHADSLPRFSIWTFCLEAAYFVLSLVFIGLVVRGMAAVHSTRPAPRLFEWLRVTRWLTLPLLALAALPWLVVVDSQATGCLEWMLSPLGTLLFDVILPATVDMLALAGLFISTLTTGLACLMALLLLPWYAQGLPPRQTRLWPRRLACFLFGPPRRLRRFDRFRMPVLWWGLFVAIIYLGGVACAMAYLHTTQVTVDAHWRQTLTPTTLAMVGICVAFWLAPGASFAAVLARSVVADSSRRLRHFLVLLAFVIVPLESGLLVTGMIWRPTMRHPSGLYIRDFAYISVLAYPFAAIVTAWLALRIARIRPFSRVHRQRRG